MRPPAPKSTPRKPRRPPRTGGSSRLSPVRKPLSVLEPARNGSRPPMRLSPNSTWAKNLMSSPVENLSPIQDVLSCISASPSNTLRGVRGGSRKARSRGRTRHPLSHLPTPPEHAAASATLRRGSTVDYAKNPEQLSTYDGPPLSVAAFVFEGPAHTIPGSSRSRPAAGTRFRRPVRPGPRSRPLAGTPGTGSLRRPGPAASS